MGKLLSTTRRAIRNYDVEHRAMKYLEKSKVETHAAPKHPNTANNVHLTDKDMETLTQRNPSLDQRVGQLTITSSVVKDSVLPEGIDYVPESTRRLPQKMDAFDPFPEPNIDFGFIVPEVVPEGRLLMRQAVNMIKSYQVEQTDVKELAAMNKIEEKMAQAIVNRFVLFNVASNRCWMPPMLLSELSQELEIVNCSKPMQLLDYAISKERTDDDVEFLGGDGQKRRRESLRGFLTD